MTAPAERTTAATEVAASFEIEGKIVEVLPGYGLAHVQTAGGQVYGLNRKTPGIQFKALREGQLVLCKVTPTFNRVLHACLLG